MEKKSEYAAPTGNIGIFTSAPRHYIDLRFPGDRHFVMDSPPNWWHRLWLRFFFGFHWEK